MGDKKTFKSAITPLVDSSVDGVIGKKFTGYLASELRGWVILPLAALGLAGFMALLLAVARVPGAEFLLPWTGQTFFQKGLVAHVTFAFVVWYMGVHGAMSVMATSECAERLGVQAGPVSEVVGKTAIYGATLSLFMMLIPAIADLGEPSLNNYIPVLVHPLFYMGLGTLAVCLSLLVIRLLAMVVRMREVEASVFGLSLIHI